MLSALNSSEASVLGLLMATLAVSPLSLSSVNAHPWLLFLHVLISSSYKDPAQIELGSTLMT